MACRGLPEKPRSLSLFSPSGPLTAKHVKNRERLLAHLDEPLVWPKSGPPTHEPRKQRGELAPALLDAKHPARMAGRAIVDLRRDLNILTAKKGGISIGGYLLSPERQQQRQQPTEEEEEWSDDELLESLGCPGGTTRAEVRRTVISRINEKRCHDGGLRAAGL
mmetsp:Transcript_120663/g.336690  ORF Transcript_120663/g.336690 Transcript_120663/m.336690 type:complete len:164 (-) Transcript_120663:90-581(-)|eukprot:CAMPEP_0179112592 /NCGR_PEP_ID=MMETSP0796-20121207/52638_1 /TAXON_ID=73915 /ORGANISM="Pyrodinium bahamense, Strain pbaha01" /LENGTH=163 /DNA_ID=CAMNT_0020810765 /DNA_START=55 /DNA_END=546 /DNA_ORIENTATION=+